MLEDSVGLSLIFDTKLDLWYNRFAANRYCAGFQLPGELANYLIIQIKIFDTCLFILLVLSCLQYSLNLSLCSIL